ncbi:MAG: hypothetical protein IJL76_01550 [Bacilli bacterium]|nr:hypothetical protein [Bacilli bacterium]
MAIFKMNTESLTSASSTINSEANKVSEVADSISGYDVSCEDDFDFAGAKSVLAANADACYNKVLNTAKLIDKCAESHMDLQNQLANMPDPAAEEASETPEEETTTTAPTTSGPSYSGPSYSGPSSSGRSHFGSKSSGTSHHEEPVTKEPTTATTTTPVTAIPSVNEEGQTYVDTLVSDDEVDDDLDQVVEETPTTTEPTETTTETPTTTEQDTNQTINVSEAPTTVGEESAKVFMDDDFSYDANGYAKLGDNYVISCNESLGKVGDKLTITSTSGETINCVIGSTTSSNDISMIVDKTVYSPTTGTTAINFNNNVANIQNEGQSSLLTPMVPGGTSTTLNDKDNLEDVIVVPEENNTQTDGS